MNLNDDAEDKKIQKYRWPLEVALWVCILFYMLCGCAQPQIIQPPIITEVDKPVSIRCITSAPDRPLYATEKLLPTATDLEYGDALAADWVLSRSYEKELEIDVQACIK